MPQNVPISLQLQPICQVLFNSLPMHTGALPSLLHPQRWLGPGAPAHCQHLHEPAQAPRVLRRAPDEEQTVVRHRVVCRVRAELRRASASLSLPVWTRRCKMAWEKKT